MVRFLPLLLLLMLASLSTQRVMAYLDPCTAMGVSCGSSSAATSTAASSAAAASSTISFGGTSSASSTLGGPLTASSSKSFRSSLATAAPQASSVSSAVQIPGATMTDASSSTSFSGERPTVPAGTTRHGAAPNAVGHPASDLTGSGPAGPIGFAILCIAGIITLIYASSFKTYHD